MTGLILKIFGGTIRKALRRAMQRALKRFFDYQPGVGYVLRDTHGGQLEPHEVDELADSIAQQLLDMMS